MKEQYVKPILVYENFSLAQTIARNCGDTHTSSLGESTHYNYDTCAWDAGGLTIFLLYVENGPCEDWGPESPDEVDGFEIEGMCYNNPDGGQEIFSSI